MDNANRKNAALTYAEKKWPVFPLKSGEKTPLTLHGFKDASTDKDKIRRWWSDEPEGNVGIVTGIDTFFVIDVDTKNGGLDSYDKHLKGKLPDTVRVNTPGGGFHLYYDSSGEMVSNRTGIYPGIDIRGDGGYVVAPPSVGENGKSYEYDPGKSPEEIQIAKTPAWLLDRLRRKSRASATILPALADDTIPEGQRNSHLTSLAGSMRRRGFGQDAIEAALHAENDQKCNPPLDPDEVASIAKSVGRYNPQQDHETNGPLSYPAAADRYLRHRGLLTDNECLLRRYRGDFYKWESTHYKKWHKDEFKADLTRWLIKHPVIVQRINKNTIAEITQMVESQVLLPGEKQVPFWINDDERSAKLISLKNGLLEVGDHETTSLSKHTSTYFSLNCLPYEYDPKASCPAWEGFLEQVLADADTRMILQEWIGYNLIADTSFQKMLFLVGEGANGKSVICLVLRLLLGDDNVTAVGLEAFSPTRTFPLASTTGMLANIVEEIGELNKPAEGVLKNYVAGGLITVEKKNRDPYNLLPTARLTFATNTKPRFSDKSSGLWRRIIAIPFKRQILEESKQDKRLVTAKFWEKELPGIFNWALKGLVRLREQGHFSTSTECTEFLNQYKKESNPAAEFLTDNYHRRSGAKINSKSLYEAYREWCAESGYSAMAKAQLWKEVRRAFPEAELTENTRNTPDGRYRFWIGIDEIDTDTVDTENSLSRVTLEICSINAVAGRE